MYQKRIDVANILRQKDPKSLKIIIGFDGFVDEIIHLVDQWISPTTYKRIETIEAFASRIGKASGLSTNIELMPIQKKIGGNGPIMCNALSLHQLDITYIGALGLPQANSIFKEMTDQAKCYSVADNGHTDAVEFLDGKVMLGKMAYLNDITYDKLVEVVGFDQLRELILNTDLFASVNWSMIPNMTNIWNQIVDHILVDAKPRAVKPFVFVDLADPEKRRPADIIEAIDTLKRYNPYFNVMLGLNKKEAFDIARILGLHNLKEMPDDLRVLALPLYDRIGIHGIMIHPVDRSCVMIDGMYYEEMGSYIRNPKLTTGAGDNFNAGTMLGFLLGLSPDQAILVGMATSGYYVRNAKSPDYQTLIQFLEDWGHNKI